MCPDIISWDKAMGKEVKSSDKKDVGKIESVTDRVYSNKGRSRIQEVLFHSKAIRSTI